jgi:hypothetical protein
MSIVPTATERSPCPPGFSLLIRHAQILPGSRFSCSSSTRLFGSAREIRGAKRSRINDPWPYRPLIIARSLCAVGFSWLNPTRGATAGVCAQAQLYREFFKHYLTQIPNHEPHIFADWLAWKSLHVHRSLFAVHCSPFTVHCSPFTVRRSLFAVRRLPFAVHRS